LAGSAMYRSEIRNLKLMGVAKTTTSNSITLTDYVDGSTTGKVVTAISPKKSGYRIYKSNRSLALTGVTHGFKAEMTTSDETIPFEPLVLSGLYKVIGEDIL
jgi:hypothetical protein